MGASTTHPARRDAVAAPEPAIFHALLEGTDLLAVGVDRRGVITYANGAIGDLLGRPPTDLLGRSWFADFVPAAEAMLLRAAFERQFRTGGGAVRFSCGLITPQGTRTIEWTAAALCGARGEIVGSAAIGVDATERLAAEGERERLAVAVEASADSIVITDPMARILYVNPAFERVTGWSRAEVVGANPRVLKSGRHGPDFYASLWSTLLAGRAWHGELVNRRRNGAEYVEEASITPVLGTDGTLLNFVAVKRDVTTARALEAQVAGSSTGAAEISAMIADLVPGETAESTAQAICERILTIAGVAYAAVALFTPTDGLRSLAVVGCDGIPIDPVESTGLTSAHRARAKHLREQARHGAWTEPWLGTTRSPMAPTFARLGVRALAAAPIELDGHLIGFVQIGSREPDGTATLRPTLPILTSFGRLAALLLGPQIGLQARRAEARAALAAIIAKRAFRSVYQPVVAMPAGRIVGYEALTRFSDGVPPDERFAAAHELGLGIELELAATAGAIAGAARLPRGAWLALNVSPAFLAQGAALAYELWKAGSRPIVLEVTEHTAIADYEELRQQVGALGIPVRLAVDDAGAGFASLRHILELRPAIIKLDRSLVTDIDSDPVRQGLVVGLRHFAAAAGSTVLAEGIETEAERSALLDLGVELGQGFLLGRPGPPEQARRTRATAGVVRAAAPVMTRPDLVHRVGAILWEADGTDKHMTFVSEGAMAITGHPASRWLMEPRFWDDHVHPDERPAILAAIDAAVGTAERVSLEYRFRLADGSYRWFQDLIEVLPGPDGHARLVGVMIDVTERRRLHEQLAELVRHDGLTGLLNRRGLAEELASASEGAGGERAILFLDLDRFKVVNDSLGHAVGDAVLREVAARLRASVRPSDAVARVGGDEFVVLAAGDRDHVTALAQRLSAIVRAPIEVGGRTIAIPVSIGIAFVRPGTEPDAAIRAADLAMYAAKQDGGGGARTFDPAMLDEAVHRLGRLDGAMPASEAQPGRISPGRAALGDSAPSGRSRSGARRATPPGRRTPPRPRPSA